MKSNNCGVVSAVHVNGRGDRLVALLGAPVSRVRVHEGLAPTLHGVRSILAPTGLSSSAPRPTLEKGMATRYSILVWRIPWTEEPGGLQSTGSQRVGHN